GLLLIKAVHQIAGRDVAWRIAVDLERAVRQLRREPRIDRRRIEIAVDDRRQLLVGLAVAIDLYGGLARRAEPVGPGEQPEHVVEAAVLLEDHDDVTDAGQRAARGGSLCAGRVKTEQGGDKHCRQRAAPSPHYNFPQSIPMSRCSFIRRLMTVL